MYKEIKPIKEFCLSEHTNNLYKKEAGSSLGLARDVAAKLNEVIATFNEFAKEKYEKIQEQDGTIRKAILYMKDNLLNTIDKLLDLKGEQMIDNSVKRYLGTLKEELLVIDSRLDTLLGSIKTGSTTLDAELIDIRTGFDGTTYANAGESVRNQIEDVSKASLNPIDISDYQENAYIRKTNGTYKDNVNGFRVSKAIEITHTKLYFKGDFHTFTDTNLVNFYSGSEINETSFIGSATPQNKNRMNEIVIPENATHMFICTSDEYYNQTKLYFGGEDLRLKQQEELSLIPINLGVDIEDKYIRTNGSGVDADGMVISQPIEVTHAKVYLKGNNKNYSSTKLINFYTNTEVSFYGYIGSYQPTSSKLQEITIPEGTKYIRVCTGANQLPLTKLYFAGEKKKQEFKTINEIMSKLILGEKHYKVKIIGDSIVNGLRGTGYTNNSDNGDLIYGSNYVNTNGYCWANELKNYLQSKYNCEVLNYGVSGVGSDVLLSKMSSVISEDDDIIICAVGTNDRVVGKDAYTGQTRTLESIYKNMNGIYTYVKRLGKEIIFIDPIPSGVSDEEGRTYHTEDIANLYTKLSVEKGIEIIPMHQLMNEYCELRDITIDSLLNDGLHPNDNGYKVMYHIICRKLGFAPKREGANW